MSKIYIRDMTSLNRGDAARALCTFKILHRFIPNLEISSSSVLLDFEKNFCESNNVRFIHQQPSTKRAMIRLVLSVLYYAFYNVGFKFDSLISDNILKEYKESDIVMSLTGDALSDDEGFLSAISFCFSVLPCIFMNSAFVFFSTSIGPFKNDISRFIAKFTLNRMGLIIIRENITKNILYELGVNSNLIKLLPDPAFILDQAPKSRIDDILSSEKIDKTTFVGITPTLVFKSFDDKPTTSDLLYFNIMAEIIDYIIETTKATVLLIPEVIVPIKGSYDDRYAALEISKLVKNKNSVRILMGEYDPYEIKGIIGLCDFFIGTKLHSCIFSASMGVPFIAIAYSHKTHGIAQMVKQENYVLDYDKLSFNDLVQKIDQLILNKERIKKELRSLEVEETKLEAWNNGKLVKALIDHRA